MKSEMKIRDEELLLLGLCRLRFSDENLSIIKDLISRVNDWDYFRKLANVHGVAALVSFNLETLKLATGIPSEVMTYLRNALMMSLSRNTFNTETMGKVLKLLNRKNIKTVILKGLALETSVYGNAGLRQMSDVDILINRNECIKAREILLSNGFTSLPVKSFFHRFILAYVGKHLPSLVRNGTSVEIHHELFGGTNKLLTGILYDSSYEVEIKGQKAWFPEPQLFFLYLVRHLNAHEMNNESQLRLYTDLVVMIDKYGIEILNDKLISYASSAGLSEILASHLGPLRDFWRVSFPGDINALIDVWYNEDSLKKFIFFLGSPKHNPLAERPKFYRYVLGDIPGFHRKFLFVLGDIFPTVSFMKKRYCCQSAWKASMYYPHRMGKILWLFRK